MFTSGSGELTRQVRAVSSTLTGPFRFASRTTTIITGKDDLGERPAKPPLRLEFLDGLRAVAALYVVLFHAGAGFSTNDLPFVARSVRHLLTFGHHAVALFIVLSGYCLMLPVARGNGTLVSGVNHYIARRAWRILPPYYAALFTTLLLLVVAPILQTPTGTIWDDTSPAFAFGPIVTHVLVVHNLFPAWIYRINGPLWSVATEWQIYFFFPLLLLPVWRRFGLIATVSVGFLVGCAPLFIVPQVAGRWVPWYLGLFSLGMSAAAIGFSPRPLERWLRERVPWRLVSLALLGACLVGVTVLIKAWFGWMPVSDALVGATTAAFLLHYTACALDDEHRKKPLVLRILESRPLVRLGHFSYSLYLIHLPIVALCYFALCPLGLSEQARMLALILVGVPASLAGAYAFFWLFERRFVGRPPAFFKRLSSRPAATR